MRFKYDFHIHSCLSPCGDTDMTPYNIVSMAKLLELDIIALTDHNTTGNCRSAMEAGADAGLTVVPGMELCTAEEIHVVCLFPDIGSAEAFGAFVYDGIPPIKNKPQVFGRQVFMDAADTEKGEEEKLLITASGVSVAEAPEIVRGYGGVCYPAHIDRPAFSLLASLGVISHDMCFGCAEVTPKADVGSLMGNHPGLRDLRIMWSSDAHYLENMCEALDTIGLTENTPAALVNYLRSL